MAMYCKTSIGLVRSPDVSIGSMPSAGCWSVKHAPQGKVLLTFCSYHLANDQYLLKAHCWTFWTTVLLLLLWLVWAPQGKALLTFCSHHLAANNQWSIWANVFGQFVQLCYFSCDGVSRLSWIGFHGNDLHGKMFPNSSGWFNWVKALGSHSLLTLHQSASACF